MRRLYLALLDSQFKPGWFFSDEAVEYLVDNLDMQFEPAVRHVMHHTLIPMYEGLGRNRAQHIKDILQWALNCATDEQLLHLDGGPERFLGDTDPPRLLFEWWWKELFGDEEDWHREGLCDAELVYIDPPEELRDGGPSWNEVLDSEVLHFPRRDGLPPGHGAPADPNRQRPPLP